MKNANEMNKSKEISPVRWILGSLAAVTLYFQTNLADPFNSPKSWLIYLFAAWLIGYAITYRRIIQSNKVLKITFYLNILFLFSMLISVIFTDFKYTAFFGDTMRRNGFISYLSLIIIFISGSIFIRLFNIKRLYLTTYLISAIIIVYAFMQSSGKDFVKWNNPYNSIIGTVGNPNFASALMAIMGVMVFSSLFVSNIASHYKLFAVAATPALLFLIYKSQSRQGLIAYLLGIGVFFIIFLFGRKRILGIVAFSIGAVAFIFSLLGMLQIGPLQNLLYKPSVSVRGYYWRAAIEMFKDNPVFGVGIDRYGAYFKQYREVGYPLSYGFDITSSNAHNTFLQFFATGGILLGTSYLLLNLYIFRRAVIGLKNFTGSNKLYLAGIFSSWIAFHAQSLISIDNVGVSIWGWVLGSSIIGLSISNGVDSVDDRKVFSGKRNEINLQRVLISGSTFAVAVLLVSFLYRAESNTYFGKANFNLQDAATRIAFQNQQVKIIETQIIDPTYSMSAAMDLIQAGFIDDGLMAAEKIHTNDYRNLDAINVLALTYQNTNQFEKAIYYRLKMAKLDPWNAANFLELGKLYKIQGNIVGSKEVLDKIISIAPNHPIAVQAKMELVD
jgi:O-antigen ligase